MTPSIQPDWIWNYARFQCKHTLLYASVGKVCARRAGEISTMRRHNHVQEDSGNTRPAFRVGHGVKFSCEDCSLDNFCALTYLL